MSRAHQVVLIGSTVLGSWLGMQAIHEVGHVLGAWLTGGRVARVVLNPVSKAPVKIPSRRAPRFTPSKELKATLASSSR